MDIDLYKSAVNRAVGNYLRQLRRNKDLSQVQIGEILEVSYQQIHRYEQGISSFSIHQGFLLLEALELDPAIEGMQIRETIVESIENEKKKKRK